MTRICRTSGSRRVSGGRIVPVPVELAEIPVDDPGPRLVLMAASGPLIDELPQVMIQAFRTAWCRGATALFRVTPAGVPV